ncbi:hypothetical protein NLX94_30625 [Streptomyces sp. TBY4]|nr:hypothetical protein [Streptomyces sp. TBY4]
MTAWSPSGGRPTPSRTGLLVLGGLSLLLLTLLGTCCSVTGHHGGASAPALSASPAHADAHAAAGSAAGCSEGEGHSTEPHESALRAAGARPCAVDEPVLAGAPDGGQISLSPGSARLAEQSKRPPAPSSDHLRSLTVLQV